MEPKLQKPGAGLPWIEAMVLRYWIAPRLTRKMSWDDCSRYFEKECKKILDAVSGLPEAKLTQKVLVDPIRGLEDSSRFWSVAMTLEHIQIVSEAILKIMETLGRHETFPLKVEIALVKPLGKKDSKSAVMDFKGFAENFVKRMDTQIQDRASPIRHRHPWFGKIKIPHWHWLVCTHVGIHRKQIQKIISGLNEL